MVYNQGMFRILSPITFETVKSQRKEKRKSLISAKIFSFSNFQALGNLETDCGIKLKKFQINYQYFGITLLFC